MVKKMSALDCTLFKDARNMEGVETGSAQLVMVTPPYLGHHGLEAKESEREFLNELFAECFRVVAPDGVVVSVNTDFKDEGMVYLRHINIVEAALKAGLKTYDERIWLRSYKPDQYRKKFSFILTFSKNKKVFKFPWWQCEPDVWVLTKSQIINGFHDAIAPEIPHNFIRNFTRVGDLVVSVCSGTGTVVIVALAENRRAIGYEINPEMKGLIKQREATINNYFSPLTPYQNATAYILAYLEMPDEKLHKLQSACITEDDIVYEKLDAVSEMAAKSIASQQMRKRLAEYRHKKNISIVPLFLKRRVDMTTIEEYALPKPIKEKLELLSMDCRSGVQ